MRLVGIDAGIDTLVSSAPGIPQSMAISPQLWPFLGAECRFGHLTRTRENRLFYDCMFTTVDNPSPPRSRKQAAEEATLAMARFPIIVEIMGTLSKAEVPLPGDADIRHGCERALTAILVTLARIEEVPEGPPSPEEETIYKMIHDRSAENLIDSDQLQRMHQFIERIFGAKPPHH